MMLVGHRDLSPGGKFNRHFASDFDGDANTMRCNATNRATAAKTQRIITDPDQSRLFLRSGFSLVS